MRRLLLSLALLLLIVGAVLFWRMRDPTIPSAEVPVPLGETVERVLTDTEGNPVALGGGVGTAGIIGVEHHINAVRQRRGS